MRSDGGLALSAKELAAGRFGGGPDNTNSLSGLERNHFFLWDGQAADFADLSALSGIDDPADGRALALLDMDRDGFTDLAIANANDPLLLLYRNQMGELLPGRHAVSLRFLGSHRGREATPGSTPRDGVGARVELHLASGAGGAGGVGGASGAGAVLVRERRAGQGFAAQNSATLNVGIGTAREVERVVVHWPGGERWERAHVPAGSLLVCYEDPAQSPSGEPIVVLQRQRARAAPEARGNTEGAASSNNAGNPARPATDGPGHIVAAAASDSAEDPAGSATDATSAMADGGTPAQAGDPAAPRFVLPLPGGTAGVAPDVAPALVLWVTFATWCPACHAELPLLRRLRAAFDDSELALIGIPVDADEDDATLSAFVRRSHAPYQVYGALTDPLRAALDQHLRSALVTDSLPASVLTDGAGRLIATTRQPPTVSRLRELLAQRH